MDPEFEGWAEAELFEHYVARKDAGYDAARRQLWLARRAESTLAASVRELMIMREKQTPASAHRLARGEYDKPRDEVFPDTPEAVLAFSDDLPRNRLGLARWALDRDNPLTARVAVNRIWKKFFGRGLVESLEDFGNQGSVPSHPALLDYLAERFIDSDWNVKALCKFIAFSATYRQDATPTGDSFEHDPENVLLARGPRKRLSAEEVRDAALFASGLLVPTIGGPSVKPYQPAGLWKESSHITYAADSGDNLYRRSMYTYLKRTVPPPMMLTFDATGREVCVARRAVTTTPLQALVLLNDPQFVESARALAERALRETGDADGALVRAFRWLTSRRPSDAEMSVMLAAHDEQAAYYDQDSAARYAAVGESEVSGEIDPIELAAVTSVVQLLMNFDEFQVK